MKAAGATVSTPSGARRLDRDARRDQLLEAGAGLLVERGLAGFSMEGLAERAGVSKALPYRHFDNADDVVNTLYRREMARLAGVLLDASEPQGTLEDSVRQIVHAYFEAIGERHALLGVLAGPGSAVAEAADGGSRSAQRFVSDLLAQRFGIPAPRARPLAPVLMGALGGALDGWAHADATRAELEDTAWRVVLGAIKSCARP